MTLRRPSAALALAAALTALAPAAPAQVVLTTSIPFLQIEPDSRASGMGMAGVALADDANSVFWNPAGLAGQQGAEVTFTHAPWLPDLGANLYFEYLAGKYAVPGIGTFAAHITYLNLGEQQWTNERGDELGTFRSYDLALGAAYGTHVLPNLAVGAGLRYIYSNLAKVEGTDATASTLVGDLGVLYRAPAFAGIEPAIGMNLANLGTSITYGADGEPNPLPTYLRIGTALSTELDEYNRLTLALDFKRLIVDNDTTQGPAPFYESIFTAWKPLEVDIDGDGPGELQSVSVLRQFTVGAGLEYWYNDLLALRTGYFYEDPANGNRQFLTFGAGFRYSLVGVDLSYLYALEENSPLDQQIRFSVLLNVVR